MVPNIHTKHHQWIISSKQNRNSIMYIQVISTMMCLKYKLRGLHQSVGPMDNEKHSVADAGGADMLQTTNFL
jgi:hypothetical protein